MTWSSFFSRPSVRCGVISGTCSLVVGTACSLAVASYILSVCHDMTDYLLEHADDTFIIPWMKAEVFPLGHNITLELENIQIKIPIEIIEMLEHARNKEEIFCYNIPLILCMFLTGMTALSIASSAAILGSCGNSKEENEENPYQVLPN